MKINFFFKKKGFDVFFSFFFSKGFHIAMIRYYKDIRNPQWWWDECYPVLIMIWPLHNMGKSSMNCLHIHGFCQYSLFTMNRAYSNHYGRKRYNGGTMRMKWRFEWWIHYMEWIYDHRWYIYIYIFNIQNILIYNLYDMWTCPIIGDTPNRVFQVDGK